MNPLNTDDYPITAATIGPASPIPYIVTAVAIVLGVGILSYATIRIIHIISRRRLIRQAQQSQVRVLWIGQ